MPPDEGTNTPPYIRIRIHPEKKAEWEEYAENEYNGTLTDLIKNSVNKAISGEWQLRQDTDTAVSNLDGLDNAVTGINDRLDDIETRIDDIALGTEPQDDVNDQELVDVAARALKYIPTVRNERQLLDTTLLYQVTLNPEDRAEVTGTAQDISAVIDESERLVRRALIYLERQEKRDVSSVIHDDTRRWYRVNENVEYPPSKAEIEEQLEHDLEFQSGSEVSEPEDPPGYVHDK